MKYVKLYIVRTCFYGYDEYDSHLVGADSEEEAIKIADLPKSCDEDISAEFIGMSKNEVKGIYHSSFNAG